MEKKIISHKLLVIQDFNPNNITRCPECNLICSLKLNYNKGESIIEYKCENQHKGSILIEEYMKNYNKFSISKEKCGYCGKTQKEIKKEFIYCSKCNQFLCYLCENNNDDGINFKRYDALCKIHSNLYCEYCINCQKNICVLCKQEHKLHDLIDLSVFNFSQNSKNKLEEEMKNLEKKYENLEEIKQKIILEIDKLKELNKLEIKFIKLLISTYQYEKSLHNLNYHTIKNIKNVEKMFRLKIELFDRIYNESDKYISFLHDLPNIKTNSLKNNYKTLKNHSHYIYLVSKLNDGRLISCSYDNSLNIYQKDSFELQLSIKEHKSAIYSFTQLIDGRIITCSSDKTMKIIKLGIDNYKIDQTLEGHNSPVNKVIEINKNELISIAYDKKMIIWKLNNENKFECICNIFFQNSQSYCNILKLNEYEFVTSSVSDQCLKFWNLNNYSYISIIKEIVTEWFPQNMILLEDNILCVGGINSKGFYLINIPKHQIIKNIIGPKTIWCINECLDGLFLCSIINENGKHSLVKYKYENFNLVKIVENENAHSSNIYSCIELDNEIIASGSEDYSIKLWKD